MTNVTFCLSYVMHPELGLTPSPTCRSRARWLPLKAGCGHTGNKRDFSHRFSPPRSIAGGFFMSTNKPLRLQTAIRRPQPPCPGLKFRSSRATSLCGWKGVSDRLRRHCRPSRSSQSLRFYIGCHISTPSDQGAQSRCSIVPGLRRDCATCVQAHGLLARSRAGSGQSGPAAKSAGSRLKRSYRIAFGCRSATTFSKLLGKAPTRTTVTEVARNDRQTARHKKPRPRGPRNFSSKP